MLLGLEINSGKLFIWWRDVFLLSRYFFDTLVIEGNDRAIFVCTSVYVCFVEGLLGRASSNYCCCGQSTIFGAMSHVIYVGSFMRFCTALFTRIYLYITCILYFFRYKYFCTINNNIHWIMCNINN